MQVCHALLYKSLATAPMSNRALAALLVEARTRNLVLGVTGHLHHEEGMFFQYLEGAKEPLDEVMALIRKDKRHHSIEQTFTSSAEPRRFGGFAMSWSGGDSGSLLAFLDREKKRPGPLAMIAFFDAARSMAAPA